MRQALSLLLFLLFSEHVKAEKCDYAKPSSGKYLLCAGEVSTLEIGQNYSVHLYTSPPGLNDSIMLHPHVTVKQSITLPVNFTLEPKGNGSSQHITVTAVRAGKATVRFYNESDVDEFIVRIDRAAFQVLVVHSKPLNIIIAVVGWVYFTAWTISFYPQIFLNFKRRSVVGLSFDFLSYNILGFFAYSVYNSMLFWDSGIQSEYFDSHPGGVIPVQLNDVIFSLHAVLVTAFTIFQCFIFERGGQRVSYVAMGILAILILYSVIIVFLAVGKVVTWLNFLLLFSYVKLAVTLIKYCPQVYLNYRRKSTVGWSIGNVLLDFTGGALSILQMFLISYNNNDWKSIFGDPTKFGLGAFSIFFDVIFMFQHYVLYRKNSPKSAGYEPIGDPKEEKKKHLLTFKADPSSDSN